MKDTSSTLISLLVLIVSLSFLASCQEEIEPEIVTNEDAIVSTDPLAQLISTVVTKDGSLDNIIDESSCTTVKFPIRGILEDNGEGNELIFNSLEEVEALRTEALEVDWVFPLQVVLFDHTEVVLNTEDELETIQDNCIEGGNDPDNECIDFVYPFTIQVFSNLTENVDSREINSDKEAYLAFTSPELVISIEYPINLMNATGSFISASSNQDLTNAISSAEGACDEEDIIEFDEVFENELYTLFTSSEWRVSFYQEDGIVSTGLFSGYTLRFNENLTLQTEGSESVIGEWDVELSDSDELISIDLETENEPLELLNEDWLISDFNETQINLEYQEEGETTKQIQLTSN